MSKEKHFNTGNTYAAKGNEAKLSHIHIRCKREEKAAIVRQLRDGEKLSEFILEAADKEVKLRNGGNDN